MKRCRYCGERCEAQFCRASCAEAYWRDVNEKEEMQLAQDAYDAKHPGVKDGIAPRSETARTTEQNG